MKKQLLTLALCLAVAVPVFAQGKEDNRLANSADVLKQIMGDKGLPTSVLDQADCVLIFPSVKKVAIGIGGSYGRGALVCRTGADNATPRSLSIPSIAPRSYSRYLTSISRTISDTEPSASFEHRPRAA